MKENVNYKEMLYFMAEHSGSYHYLKGKSDEKWSALDCRNGLSFICRNVDSLEEAVHKAKEYHASKTK